MPEELDGKLLLTVEDLKPIVEADGIIDGSKGGLILGNSHLNSGVKIIAQYKNEKLYEIIAEVEGWEFIMSPKATAENLEYLKMMNSEFKGTSPGFCEYDIPQNVEILDTRPFFENIKETNKLIIFGDYAQFIINRNSTKKYLSELNELNKKYSV